MTILGRLAAWVLRAALALGIVLIAATGHAGAREANGISVIWEPIYDQLEVFWVGGNGAIRWVYKEKNGLWHEASDITPAGVAIPGTAVTPLWQVEDSQLEVFWIGRDGAVNDVYKDHNGSWHQPIVITGAGFAPAGAPLTGFWQPHYHQLHVFGIAADGSLSMVYKADNKAWNAPFARMTVPGFGVPGSKPAAIFQDPWGESMVLAAGADGAVNLIWKAFNEKWHTDIIKAAPAGTAAAGASLSAVYQPPFDQVEVFLAAADGAAVSVWKGGENIFGWTASRLTGPNFAVPGSSISGVYQDLDQHLEVFGIAADGSVNDVWKGANGAWAQPFAIASPNNALAGNTLSAVREPTNNQMEVIWRDAAGTVWDGWKAQDKAWNPPGRLTNVAGTSFITPAMCTRFFNAWGAGERVSDELHMVIECQAIMGINLYCAAHDALPYTDLYGNAGNLRRLICVQNFHKDTVDKEFTHLVNGIGEGLSDAMVAAAPYMGMVVEGASCLSGVVYGCAALALDVIDKIASVAGVDLGDAPLDAIPIAKDALACASGNIISCVSLGQKGIKSTTGYTIPGGDSTQAAFDAKDCADGGFAACARLGQKAAEAAGLPTDVIPAGFTSIAMGAYKCLSDLNEDKAGNCLSLGIQTAAAAIPKGGLASLAASCANGNTADCLALGKSAAKAAGLPVDLGASLVNSSVQCAGNDLDACVDIGVQAVRASGIPLLDLGPVRQCANGDVGACSALGSTITGLPFADKAGTARTVSQCVAGDVNACIALGKLTLDNYAPDDLATAIATKEAEGLLGQAKAGTLRTAQAANTTPWVPPSAVPPPQLPGTAAPAADAMPAAASPGAGVSFSGSWVTKVQNGVIYNLKMTQDTAGHVSGDYVLGTITNGIVIGRDLFAVWTQGGATGTVLFHLAPDGTAFAGMWTQSGTATRPTAANAKGSWDGYSSNVFTKATASGEFAGKFTLNRDATGASALTLEINGDQVSGSYQGGTLAGTVVHSPGRPTEFTVAVVDTSSGQGSFFLYPDGSGFSGYWHSSAAGLNAWSGVLVEAAAPPAGGPGSEGPGAGGPGSEAPPAVVTPPAQPEPQQTQPAPQPPPAASDVKLPQGACPAASAVVTTARNVHHGLNGPVTGSLPRGAAVECLACDKSWCLIASDDPQSTFSRKYLDFSDTAKPAQKSQDQTPADSGTASVSGDWTLRSDTDWRYQVAFVQSGQKVTGSFVDQAGMTAKLSGTVKGNVLSFSWTEAGGDSATARFTVDGDTVDGTYTFDGGDQGKWNGRRSDPPSVDFNGDWTVESDKGWHFAFNFKQQGAKASATFVDQDGRNGKLRGVVAGNTFSFAFSEDGGYTGGGRFSISDDGQSMSGLYHTNAHDGMDPDNADGNWWGTRGAAPPVAEQPAATADFNGDWNVASDKDWHYKFHIDQAGNNASASFVDQNGLSGQLTGTVSGQVFTYTWTEDGGYAGSGQFTMNDGGGIFDGTYVVSQYPQGTDPSLLTGTWGVYFGGTTNPAPAPAAPGAGVDANIDYGGCGGCGKPAPDDLVVN